MKGRKMSKDTRAPRVGRQAGAAGADLHPPGQVAERARNGIRDAAARAYRGENSGLLLMVMLAAVVIFGILLRDTTFLGSSNLLSIVETTTAVTVMAVPTVFVICSGEIDLSFATVVPVSAYVSALLLQHNNIVIAILGGLAFGALVGLINGAVTVWFKI